MGFCFALNVLTPPHSQRPCLFVFCRNSENKADEKREINKTKYKGKSEEGGRGESDGCVGVRTRRGSCSHADPDGMPTSGAEEICHPAVGEVVVVVVGAAGHIPAAAIILDPSFNTVLMHPHTGLKTSSLRPLNIELHVILYTKLRRGVWFEWPPPGAGPLAWCLLGAPALLILGSRLNNPVRGHGSR
ncbi:unnamed protein product [Arctogadus glacialis]